MKKITSLLSVLLAVLLLLASCATRDSSDDGIESRVDNHENTIASLELQIFELQQNQYIYGTESDKKIAELTAQLNALKAETDTKAPQTDAPADEELGSRSGFTYTLSNGLATVTGYGGEDTQLVIPASIDGHRVSAIADGAFENSSVKSVIVSDGIETIGWFAFNGCVSLRSVTLPSSVRSIGYSAFGSAGSGLTVYCHSDSFALSYAKSYGLSYTVI